MFHKMGSCLGWGEDCRELFLKSLRGLSLLSRCPVAEHQTVVLGKQRHLQMASAGPGWNSDARPLRFIKQLKVQADHNLSRGDLVQQETLGNWTLGTLVLLDVGDTDLCPTQKIWKKNRPCSGGGFLLSRPCTGIWEVNSLPSPKRELGHFVGVHKLQ